jgi:hypothetical protein
MLCPAIALAEAPAAKKGDVLVERSLVSARTGTTHLTLRVHRGGLVESWPVAGCDACSEQLTTEAVTNWSSKFEKALADKSLSTESLHKELQQQSKLTGLSSDIENADLTVLSIRTPSGLTELRCRGVGVLQPRFPQAQRLQSFARLDEHASNLAAIVHVGGHPAAKTLCEAANRQLVSEHPSASRYSIDDLKCVRTSPGGGRYIQFCKPCDAAMPDEFWTTSIIEFPGQPTRVSVIPPASLVQ